MKAETVEALINHVEVSAEFGRRATEKLAAVEAEQAKAASEADGLVDYLLASKLYDPSEKDALRAKLASHSGVMGELYRVSRALEGTLAKQATEIGRGVPDFTKQPAKSAKPSADACFKGYSDRYLS